VLVQDRHRGDTPPAHRAEEAAFVLRRNMRAQLFGAGEIGGAFSACAQLYAVRAPHVRLHGVFISEIGCAPWFGAGNSSSNSRDGVPPDVYLKSFIGSELLWALRAGEVRIRVAPFVVHQVRGKFTHVLTPVHVAFELGFFRFGHWFLAGVEVANVRACQLSRGEQRTADAAAVRHLAFWPVKAKNNAQSHGLVLQRA
jgi:hypothetical protein